MIVSDSLAQKILSMEADTRQRAREAEQVQQKASVTRTHIENITETMSFWDKYLWGWFGDKQRIEERNALRSTAAEFEEQAGQLNKQVASAPAQTKETIRTYLEQNDPEYQRLVIPYVAASKVSTATDDFVERIDNALSKVSSAESTETLDLFTDSSVISIMSSSSNSSANDAISDVRDAAPDFQKAIEEFHNNKDLFKPEQVALSGVNDDLDLVFDLVFDGFDFMSLSTLSSLSTAKTGLRNTRHSVEPLQAAFNETKKQAEEKLVTYRDQVYAAIQLKTQPDGTSIC